MTGSRAAPRAAPETAIRSLTRSPDRVGQRRAPLSGAPTAAAPPAARGALALEHLPIPVALYRASGGGGQSAGIHVFLVHEAAVREAMEPASAAH
jgi:hypothetical protein